MSQVPCHLRRTSASLPSAMLAACLGLASAFAWSCSPKPAASTEPSGPATAAPLDKAAGEALVAKRCVGCHAVDKVYEKKTDAAGWEAIMTDMEQRGLKIDAVERKQIIDFLASR